MMPEIEATPQRLPLSRAKGFDLQALSVATNGLPATIVSRPGKWGNPFAIADIIVAEGLDQMAAQARAVALCTQWLDGTLDPALSPAPAPTLAAIRKGLAGQNLACWCKAGTPCHADVLLRLANS